MKKSLLVIFFLLSSISAFAQNVTKFSEAEFSGEGTFFHSLDGNMHMSLQTANTQGHTCTVDFNLTGTAGGTLFFAEAYNHDGALAGLVMVEVDKSGLYWNYTVSVKGAGRDFEGGAGTISSGGSATCGLNGSFEGLYTAVQ